MSLLPGKAARLRHLVIVLFDIRSQLDAGQLSEVAAGQACVRLLQGVAPV